MIIHRTPTITSLLLLFLLLASCGNSKKTTAGEGDSAAKQVSGPAFIADSAFQYCAEQCAFGPRTMNSEAHEQCAQWIAAKFRQYGMEVTLQQTPLTGYDGTTLHSTNIIASYQPGKSDRILLCAHWDSRPWADNDPDSQHHHTPVMAANDGASGVGVMLEIARLVSADTLNIGLDFICFDAEDWGTPQWEKQPGDNDTDTWALGAQYWAAHPHRDGYTARYGILLDMVGGQGARFFQEGVSLHYAPDIVKRVWTAAELIGYGSIFPKDEGGMITDDHLPVNRIAKIPCIDIIPYYPDCEQSSFGPTWHTIIDDMDHLDKTTLQAVGQTLIQVIYSE